MLTLIIKADGDGKNILEKEQEFVLETKAYVKNVNVLYIAHNNFSGLETLKQIVVQNDAHELFVCDHKTTDEEMIEMALFMTGDGDVLLLSIETNKEIVKELMERRSQGYKIVKVRKKTNFCHQFFRVLGNWSYNLGLKMDRKNSDNFSEAEVMFLDSNIVNSLRENIENSRETRVCNTFSQTKHMTVETKKVFDNEPKIAKQEQTMFKYGMWTFMFILGFIALTSIYPFFHSFTYSWWMILLIVFWVGFGLFLTFVCSRKVFFKRTNPKNRVTPIGEPLFGYDDYYKTGDELIEKQPLPKIDTPIIKNKTKKLRRK